MDNDWRNARIEEAAKALDKNFNPDKHPIMAAMFRDYAATCLAVFEKAHTPTDDEREALWANYAVTVERLRKATAVEVSLLHRTWMDGFAAGFRRSEVPEPSGPWDSALSCFGHCDKEGWYGECVSKKSEPQGEPSDAEVEAAHQAWSDYWDQDESGDNRPAIRAALIAAREHRGGTFRDGVQLDPDRPEPPFPGVSDAQVMAFMNSYRWHKLEVTSLSRWSPEHVERIRAALRAAGEIR